MAYSKGTGGGSETAPQGYIIRCWQRARQTENIGVSQLLTDEGIVGITKRDIKLSPVYRNFLLSASIVQTANRHTTDVISN